MQHAVVRPIGQPDVRSRVKPGPIARDNPDNVAGLQLRLDPGDSALGNLVKRALANPRLHLANGASSDGFALRYR